LAAPAALAAGSKYNTRLEVVPETGISGNNPGFEQTMLTSSCEASKSASLTVK
jgi:hypothetical protein